ncbi:ABC transporter permease [Cohnella thailandensis]|uniref:ABC transporter permease n=1 Tax=Cohnella thailandensis TaxID=557557 RepID=A0A841SVZ6_9BACL|nr:ABC transporter permease [Cohnella thailandensis]MBB6634786.1 ABC transporter permease [Cohnella thailandensis]MBP1975993.1 sulfonate transport system permease protein [Cohnella thailandensis]
MSEQAQTLRAPAVRTGRKKNFSRGKGTLLHFVAAALLPAVILIVWQWYGATGRVNPLLLPSPLAIAKAFGRLIASGELPMQLGFSLGRASLGILYGAVVALILGAAVGFSRKIERVLDPLMQILRLTPSLATAPLIILWFGFGETSKIVIIAFGSFFPLYMGVIQSIRNVDKKLFEVTQVLEFGRGKQLARLILPASLPGILSGLRLCIAYGWLALVVAELLGSQTGIGFLMSQAQTNSQPETVFVGVIVFAVMGKLIDSFVAAIERRLLRWRDNYTG